MGNAQTKEEPVLDSGIYVTPGLVAQLQGGSLKRRLPAASQPEDPLRSVKREQAVLERLKQSKELRDAYEESRLAGDLLLKREEEELARVDQYAEELMRKEYKIPSREPPCLPERSKVTACYKENMRDPLLCAEFVDAYAICAEDARKAFTASQLSKQSA